MKTRVNLTIDDDILSGIKNYAELKNTSLSALAEEHFKNLTGTPKRKNIIDLVEQLPTQKSNLDGDLQDQFYEERASKYGF